MQATADTVVYDESMSHSADSEQVPFLKKELQYVIDQNGSGDYSRNEAIFETINISNGAKWADFRDAFLSIPTVTVISRDAQPEPDHTAGGALPDGLRWKSGPVIIDSVMVQFGNNTVVQQRRGVSAWCSFKQHTTQSMDDVQTKGDSWSYFRPSNAWSWSDSRGLNCAERAISHDEFTAYDANTAQVTGTTALFQANGGDSYEYDGSGTTKKHIYRKDIRIRLRDLLLFDELPLLKGSNFKITLTFNQCESVSDYADNAVLIGAADSLRGSMCPVIRTNPTPGTAHTELISVKVGQNGIYKPQKSQCRLYVPSYTMSSEHELAYMGRGVQKVRYTDVFTNVLQNNLGGGASFSHLVSNSLSRMKRLIMVPMLAKHATNAGGRTPQQSPYTHEPSVCSPCTIRDFNVKLSGNNVYNSPVQYKYESFLDELSGKFGVNGGRDDGITSGLINMRDYENNFGYIVVDLSRRLKYDDNTPLSLQIDGTVASPMALDFHLFVEFERDISIDITTGAMV